MGLFLAETEPISLTNYYVCYLSMKSKMLRLFSSLETLKYIKNDQFINQDVIIEDNARDNQERKKRKPLH